MPPSTLPPMFAEKIAHLAPATIGWISSGDWTRLPEGYFAVPIFDDFSEATVLGYRLYRRRVPKTSKTGRVYGRDGFTVGAIYGATEDARDRIKAITNAEIALYGGYRWAWVRAQVADLLTDPALYRRAYGMVTGRCGWCGRALTDPDSKLRGVGPECARRSR